MNNLLVLTCSLYLIYFINLYSTTALHTYTHACAHSHLPYIDVSKDAHSYTDAVHTDDSSGESLLHIAPRRQLCCSSA